MCLGPPNIILIASHGGDEPAIWPMRTVVECGVFSATGDGFTAAGREWRSESEVWVS